MKVPRTSVFDYLNYQMFTEMNYGTSQEVFVRSYVSDPSARTVAEMPSNRD